MKTLRSKNLLTALALLFIMTMSQVGINASVGAKVSGRLKTRNNKPVIVNGNKVASGMTVFSGASIQCPEGVGATVDLGRLGRLDLAPLTNMTVTFTENEVSVKLISGCVLLTTNKDIKGTVFSEGETYKTDSSKASSLSTCTAGSVGPETSGVAIGAGGAGGIGGAGAAAIVGGAGAAVGGAAAAAGSKGSDRGKAVSPSTPQ